ncbi:cytochrome P450 2D6-like protein [Leptotrombidium deliense]|uniref:Cytochrome P450 2D6-like protein n=1 Tax=Leptotrombidium deliense TaxID=299467 RepID=A0A443SB23_9ACAR|nr:cytochrome P450 2D6-like protein [Leptotrombidium deliense]
MAANREVQQKVHDEIIDTFGASGSFCYLDRHRVPYTQAVIAEIHRFMILVPFASFHVNRCNY